MFILRNTSSSLVPEPTLQQVPEHIADDLISCLPHETAVAIFAILCFKDLIRTQLVSIMGTTHLCQDKLYCRTKNNKIYLYERFASHGGESRATQHFGVNYM
jgi:hypothetical protein